jgi:hypothetical protein
MVDELKMPAADAGLQIDGHQALGVEIIARPVSAVIVR